ncbi:TPA: DedA family protein [Staphylococcus aureus]|nr:DedA family protein [Staphylococcus aureus]
MEQIITEFISRFGYAAIFILILLENVLPIVPSEIILTFAGLMSVKSHLSILTLFIIATIASFIGLLILYYICRFIPVLRVLITIPAGVNRMNVVTFTVISLIGTTIWNFGLILLGRTLSNSFGMLMTGLHTYSRIMYVVIIIAVIYFAIRYIGKRKRVK